MTEMTIDQIVAALEKNGDMTQIVQTGNREFRGNRKGKTITVKLIKYRQQWQLTASDGSRSVPSNTFPWQEAVFDSLHWDKLD